MKTIIHKANTRGHADYGWLKTYYSFSFANYYNPERVNFGTLRVLNDDFVDAGMGFDRHPHDNMEIVTIPLEGELEHVDSMGNKFIIRKNDIQVMSAGTGIFHSEYNRQPDKPVKLFQIWVFPSKRNITPRYDQKTYSPEDRINKWQRVVSPNEEGVAWINQDAYFSLARLDEGTVLPYTFNNPAHGAYIFIIEGNIELDGIQLDRRDGIGVWDTSSLSLKALKASEVLLMEIPMM